LKKLHFMNSKISKEFNTGLGAAAKKLFPAEAKIAAARKQPWASHVARALNVNASVELYMKPGESVDVFMRDHLQHANFGTSVSYKQVTFKRKGIPVASDTLGLAQSVAALKGKVNELETRLNDRKAVNDRGGKVEKEHKEGGGEVGGGVREGEPPQKKKKPNVPEHRPVGPQIATLKDRYGNTHTFTKLPRVVGLGLAGLQARVDKVETMLLDKDISLSADHLRAMGIGQRSLCLRQTSTKANCDPLDYAKEKSAASE